MTSSLRSTAKPVDARAGWSSISTIAGACGGCGERPTRADIESFVNQWISQASYRGTLLDPSYTTAGVVLRADGAGRKIALLVLGAMR